MRAFIERGLEAGVFWINLLFYIWLGLAILLRTFGFVEQDAPGEMVPDVPVAPAETTMEEGGLLARSLVVDDFIPTTSSYDVPIEEGETDTLAHFLQAPAEQSPEYQAIQASNRAHMEKTIAKMPPAHQLVINMRYGFYEGEVFILESIAGALGVTKERCRLLETEALRLLRASWMGSIPPKYDKRTLTQERARKVLQRVKACGVSVLRHLRTVGPSPATTEARRAMATRRKAWWAQRKAAGLA